jgi:hypothetical protein
MKVLIGFFLQELIRKMTFDLAGLANDELRHTLTETTVNSKLLDTKFFERSWK